MDLRYHGINMEIDYEPFPNIVVANSDGIVQVTQDCSEIASAITKSQTKDVKQIWIHSIQRKLKHEGEYSICSTYTDDGSDLCFYFTTSACVGNNYLLNLFAIHRKLGNFRVGVSDSNEIEVTRLKDTTILSTKLKNYYFKTSQADEHHYIKTFHFSSKQLDSMKNILVIQADIQLDCLPVLDNDLVMKVKKAHNFNELLTKTETADFVIETRSGRQYKIHTILLPINNPKLNSVIKSNQKSMVLDISDENMELLYEFLYTGIIQDVHKYDINSLLHLAEQFQLDNLFALIDLAIELKLNVDNAVELAILSEKYNLQNMQDKVFNYIINNSEVINSEGWHKLENTMMKKLCQRVLVKINN